MPALTTTIEENSPLISYSDGWTTGTSADNLASRYSESSFMKTKVPGASASFTFNGTAVQIFGAKRNNHGAYVVKVDDTMYPSADGKAPDPGLFQQSLFEVAGLQQGLHEVTITNQGNSLYLDIDFISWITNVGEPAGNFFVNTVQDTDPSFAYSSSPVWMTNPQNVGSFLGGSGQYVMFHPSLPLITRHDIEMRLHLAVQHRTRVLPSYLHSRVREAVSLYGPVGPNGVSYTVELDGDSPRNFTSNKELYTAQVLLYHANTLTSGQHHLKLTSQPTTAGQAFAVDFANVFTTIPATQPKKEAGLQPDTDPIPDVADMLGLPSTLACPSGGAGWQVSSSVARPEKGVRFAEEHNSRSAAGSGESSNASHALPGHALEARNGDGVLPPDYLQALQLYESHVVILIPSYFCHARTNGPLTIIMVAGPAVPGLFLCFAATVLLVFVSVSVPTWDKISFLNVGIGANQIRYGVFGFTGSKVAIGYDFQGTGDSNLNTMTIHNLTRALILHPIAAGISGLAFLFGLCGASYHRFGTIFMSLLSGLAAIVTLVIFVIDMALFGIARHRFREAGTPAQYGNANWLTVGALAALLLGFYNATVGIDTLSHTRVYHKTWCKKFQGTGHLLLEGGNEYGTPPTLSMPNPFWFAEDENTIQSSQLDHDSARRLTRLKQLPFSSTSAKITPGASLPSPPLATLISSFKRTKSLVAISRPWTSTPVHVGHPYSSSLDLPYYRRTTQSLKIFADCHSIWITKISAVLISHTLTRSLDRVHVTYGFTKILLEEGVISEIRDAGNSRHTSVNNQQYLNRPDQITRPTSRSQLYSLLRFSAMSFTTKEINESYFNALNFESLMRGVHLVVYIMALARIYTGPPRAGQSRLAMAILVSVFFILSTADLGSYWAYVRRAFIAHGETAESTAAALNEYPPWFLAMMGVSDFHAILADCVIIWRTWVIWGKNWKITVFPILLTLLTIAFSIIATYNSIKRTTFDVLYVDFATALYSTTLASTIFCTCAIIYRIAQIGSLGAYRGVIEIIIESSLLYAVATLFALLAYIYSGPASEYATAFWTSCTGIAPTLVVARVAAGHARPNQTWTSRTTKAGNRMSGLLSLPRITLSRHGAKGTGVNTRISMETRTYVYDPEDPMRSRIDGTSSSDEDLFNQHKAPNVV
ncbi:hypothetical protein LshimejAT787_1901640 [Lyophyllum shimeji]|uniref:Uncharacterized protein n=1 Tax=Lyophyllum shimeji TaxID=47721 RepID=A0A9P3UWG9_LYOSH|nr:hypothetical protein LshimejAT787_1901640 [Lyophyllum shimeji]